MLQACQLVPDMATLQTLISSVYSFVEQSASRSEWFVVCNAFLNLKMCILWTDVCTWTYVNCVNFQATLLSGVCSLCVTLTVLVPVSLILVVFQQETPAILEVRVVRFKRVFDIRWLSLGNCVAALIRNYEPLMVVLKILCQCQLVSCWGFQWDRCAKITLARFQDLAVPVARSQIIQE